MRALFFFQIKNKKDGVKITVGFLKSFSVGLSPEKEVTELKKMKKFKQILSENYYRMGKKN
jgi:hypothetical protein